MGPSLARRLRRALRGGALAAAAGLSLLAGAPPPARAAAPSDSLTVTITPLVPYRPGPVKDLAAAAGAEGQLLLSWTAPDAYGNVYASSYPAAGYAIRVATFSVASVGGSTTAWWSGATDVGALSAPAIPASPPAPAFPGTTQYLLLNQLWPGVTYYAMIVSTNASGLSSGADLNSIPPAVQASTLVYDAPPPAPAGLAAVAASTSSLAVSWTAVAAYDLDFYRVSFDSTPPYDFSRSSTTVVFAPATSVLLTGLSTGTYALRMTAVDRGAPRYPGAALASAYSSSITAQLLPIVRPPQQPMGVWLDAGPSSATVHWLPVQRYADTGFFAVPSSPTAAELSGYRVDRATLPYGAVWTELGTVSTATLSYLDAAGGYGYYYAVRAENPSGLSPPSAVGSAGSLSSFVVAPDGLTSLEVLWPQSTPLVGDRVNPASAFLVQASSHPEDLGGRVIKSVEFTALQGGVSQAPLFELPGLGILRLHFAEAAGAWVAPSGRAPASVAPTPGNVGVYWYNGRVWLQMYGTLDATAQTYTVQTKYLGRYQLRTVERTGQFSFDKSGVSNRLITPNGDGKNDTVVFTFDNPRDSAVTARILDLQGKVVAGPLPAGPIANSAVWDGTSGGRVVPSGVYIYSIEAEGQVYTGTVVIIR